MPSDSSPSAVPEAPDGDESDEPPSGSDRPTENGQTADGDQSVADASTAGRPDRTGRDVVVPDRVYKTVTVFSTLFAVVTVVVGFVVLDRATNRATAPIEEVDPLLALAGVGLIVLGAVTYAFSTRFRAEGMGKSKDAADEVSDDG